MEVRLRSASWGGRICIPDISSFTIRSPLSFRFTKTTGAKGKKGRVYASGRAGAVAGFLVGRRRGNDEIAPAGMWGQETSSIYGMETTRERVAMEASRPMYGPKGEGVGDARERNKRCRTG